MSELEDRLNGLLSDPEQMGRLAQIAKSIMGGGGTDDPPPTQENSGLDFDPGMLSRIGGMLNGMNGEKDDKKALLEAMKPYLAEKRRQKMDRALKIAKMAKLANLALKEYGGDGNGL